jgi:predicted ATPase
MPSIKAAKIEFKPGFPFRKFKNLTIALASRITLMYGHNGVGKSTILGLLSGLSGRTDFLSMGLLKLRTSLLKTMALCQSLARLPYLGIDQDG